MQVNQHIATKSERYAALAAAIVAGAVFFYHLAPGVTLPDSGELVTAAFTFGVPHPPGYPLWTLLGFLWSHCVVPFGNPAWRIGLMSVTAGAAVVGVMTLTMIRCTRALLDSLAWNESIDARLKRWMAITVGVSTALLFGFNHGVWHWACMPEQRALQTLLVVSAFCAFLTWLVRPDRHGYLYIAVALFAVDFDCGGWGGSYALAISIYLGAVLAAIDRFIEARRGNLPRYGAFRTAMTSLSTFWELSIAGLLGFICWLLLVAWIMMPHQYAFTDDFWPLAVSATGIAVLAIFGWHTQWWSARRAWACAGLLVAGYAIHLYLPLAAATNPPMNWGYTATKDFFLHVVTRGSYESWGYSLSHTKLIPAFRALGTSLVEQYSLPLTLLTLAPLAMMTLCGSRTKACRPAWFVFLWVAFVATSLGILPNFQWTTRAEDQWPMLAPAHALYAMLIGLGIAATLSLIAAKGPQGSGRVVRWLCVGMVALPLIPFTRNLQACTQRGNDFGYRFGHLLFEPGYGQPPMEKNAILFAGTDAGRFVATYMVFCESRLPPRNRFGDPAFDRSDVCVITQNALADNTYMSYIRDQYDVSRPDTMRPETVAQYPNWRRSMFDFGWKHLGRDRAYPLASIRLPSQEDANRAFQEYVKDVQSGRFQTDTGPNRTNGFCTLRYVAGVMHINGILARMIFDRNKDDHAFYVEESYVIPWMVPHLRPCGVIMKLEKEPLPPPEQNPQLWNDIKARDRTYWDGLSKELLARSEFRRDSDARKTFAKLRCAIAGVYGSHGLFAESEYAFQQALGLCPESPETSFRLANLYEHDGRYAEARRVMEDYMKFDQDNRNAREYIEYLKAAAKDSTRH